MLRRSALALVAAAGPLLLVAFVAGGSFGAWVAGLLAPGLPLALVAFAAARSAGVRAVLLLLAVSMEGAAAALLLGAFGERTALGTPVPTWIMLAGLGVVPLVLATLGHALAFEPGRARGIGR